MTEDQGWPVRLYLYDISRGLARSLSQVLLGKYIEGVWHTGVVVYGTEYYWGGVIQQGVPGTSPFGSPTKIIDVGVTYLPRELFEEWLEENKSKYTVETYSLLSNNCNNFSQEAVNFLTGRNIPEYITNLPNEFLNTGFGQMVRPLIEEFERQLKSMVNVSSIGSSSNSQSTQSTTQPSSVPPLLSSSATTTRTATITSSSSSNVTGKTTDPKDHPSSVSLPPTTNNDTISRHQKISESFCWLKSDNTTKKPMLAIQSNIVSILPKLKNSLKLTPSETSEWDLLESYLKKLEVYLNTNTNPNEHLHNIEPLSESLFKYLKEKLALLLSGQIANPFPLLYVLRLLVVEPRNNKLFVENEATQLRALFNKYLNKNVSKSTLLMTVLLGINLFGAPEGTKFMIEKSAIDFVIPAVLQLIDAKETLDVRQTAAGLVFNYCLYIPSQGIEDAVILLYLSLSQFVSEELTLPTTDKELIWRLSLSLGQLLLNNKEAVTLATQNELKTRLNKVMSMNCTLEERTLQLLKEILLLL